MERHGTGDEGVAVQDTGHGSLSSGDMRSASLEELEKLTFFAEAHQKACNSSTVSDLGNQARCGKGTGLDQGDQQICNANAPTVPGFEGQPPCCTGIGLGQGNQKDPNTATASATCDQQHCRHNTATACNLEKQSTCNVTVVCGSDAEHINDSATASGLDSQPRYNLVTVSGCGDECLCNTTHFPDTDSEFVYNSPTSASHEKQPYCDTALTSNDDDDDDDDDNWPSISVDDLEDTKHVGDDEPEGLKRFMKKKYKKVKEALTRSTKRERVPNQLASQVNETKAEEPRVTDDPDVYNFSHRRRGLAVIIDNEKFSQMPSRPGSCEDSKALESLFKSLKFEVKHYRDLTEKGMDTVLSRAAAWKEHEESDCLVVAILSHGEEIWQSEIWNKQKQKVRHDVIFGVDGLSVLTSSIMEKFNDEHCPALKGKPRLFFLQACRGSETDPGQQLAIVSDAPGYGQRCAHQPTTGEHRVDRQDGRDTDEQYQANIHQPTREGCRVDGQDAEDSDEQGETDARPGQGQTSHNTGHRSARGQGARRSPPVSPAPIFNDFLVMYATPPGFYAWRRPSGSWFVQSLCAVFRSYTPQRSLMQALTRVTHMVTTLYQSENKKNPKMAGMKQTPVIETRLLKDIYFT